MHDRDPPNDIVVEAAAESIATAAAGIDEPTLTAQQPLDKAIDFLMLLRPDGPWQLSAINPNVDTNNIETVTATCADEARDFICRYSGKRNLYYAPNPVRIKNKKAAKTEVSAIEFLLGDLDPNDGEAPEDAKARFLAALKSFEPAPMFVVDSGNGVQVLWRLDQPIPLPNSVMVTDADGKTKPALSPEAQTIVDKVEARAKAAMEKLGSVAGTQNIDRILRLPGSKNLPTKAKIKKGRKVCQSSLLAYNELAVCGLVDFRADSGGTKADSSGDSTKAASSTSIADSNTRVGNPDGTSSIDWAVVEKHLGWLKGTADLHADFSVKGKAIIGHSGNLNDLNFDLQHAGTLVKPYQSWSEVSFALAATTAMSRSRRHCYVIWSVTSTSRTRRISGAPSSV
jgi:hypothetical protein